MIQPLAVQELQAGVRALQGQPDAVGRRRRVRVEECGRIAQLQGWTGHYFRD